MGHCRRMFAPLLAAALLAVPASTPAQPPAPAMPAITPARIAEIMAFVQRSGACQMMPSETSAPLGLTETGVHYWAVQASLTWQGREHFWSAHEQSRGVAMVFAIEGRSVDIWVFDLRGNLMSAATIRGGVLSLVPIGQARAGFEAEMRLWSAIRLTAPPNQPVRPCNRNSAAP